MTKINISTEEKKDNGFQNKEKPFKLLSPDKKIAYILAFTNLLITAIPFFSIFEFTREAVGVSLTKTFLFITTICFSAVLMIAGILLVIFSYRGIEKIYRVFGGILFGSSLIIMNIVIVSFVIPYSFWYSLSPIFILIIILSLIGIVYGMISLVKEKNFYALFGIFVSLFTALYQLYYLICLNIALPPGSI
jgi:hypothetical protein